MDNSYQFRSTTSQLNSRYLLKSGILEIIILCYSLVSSEWIKNSLLNVETIMGLFKSQICFLGTCFSKIVFDVPNYQISLISIIILLVLLRTTSLIFLLFNFNPKNIIKLYFWIYMLCDFIMLLTFNKYYNKILPIEIMGDGLKMFLINNIFVGLSYYHIN